jgi:hypothetical protein
VKAANSENGENQHGVKYQPSNAWRKWRHRSVSISIAAKACAWRNRMALAAEIMAEKSA